MWSAQIGFEVHIKLAYIIVLRAQDAWTKKKKNNKSGAGKIHFYRDIIIYLGFFFCFLIEFSP